MLGLATSLAMTGKVAEAQASQKGLAMAVEGLKEEMLAVEQELRLFATSEDSISTEVFWAGSPNSTHAKGSSWRQGIESEAHSSTQSMQPGFKAPASKPAHIEQTPASSCSSISFTRGAFIHPDGSAKRWLEKGNGYCLPHMT